MFFFTDIVYTFNIINEIDFRQFPHCKQIGEASTDMFWCK